MINNLSGKYEIVEYDSANGQDILDYDELKEVMRGCDTVVHLAAIRKPVEDKTFSDYFRVNCEGTLNVTQAALENGIKRLIFASSTSYYGIEKGISVKTPVREDNLVLTQRVKAEQLTNETRDCDIAYSTSKVIAEQILANYGMTKKFEVVVLRFAPVRKRGEYRPFGELKLHLKIENALQALEAAIRTDKKIWYEAFTITDESNNVDISKAKNFLGYSPV